MTSESLFIQTYYLFCYNCFVLFQRVSPETDFAEILPQLYTQSWIFLFEAGKNFTQNKSWQKNVCKCIVCRQENNFVQLRNKEKFNLNLLKLMFQSSKFFLGINCNIVEWLWVDIWSSFPMDSAASWKGWASVEAFVFNELGKTKQLSNSSSISTTFIK